jgi:hypothetical protein
VVAVVVHTLGQARALPADRVAAEAIITLAPKAAPAVQATSLDKMPLLLH